jgi:hypothetical protein
MSGRQKTRFMKVDIKVNCLAGYEVHAQGEPQTVMGEIKKCNAHCNNCPRVFYYEEDGKKCIAGFCRGGGRGEENQEYFAVDINK